MKLAGGKLSKATNNDIRLARCSRSIAIGAIIRRRGSSALQGSANSALSRHQDALFTAIDIYIMSALALPFTLEQSLSFYQFDSGLS